jgi:hypothetical protein
MLEEVRELSCMAEDMGVEAANPEWFCWFVDQGLFSLYEVKKRLEVFGSKILPQYA